MADATVTESFINIISAQPGWPRRIRNWTKRWLRLMICDICGAAKARVRRVAKSFGKGKDLFVIENVPVISCTRCGESYLTAETIHEIDRLLLHRKAIAEERSVPVVSFSP